MKQNYFKEFYFNTEPRLKWNKIILAWIFMRQFCSQSLHLSTVIIRRQQAIAAGERRKFPCASRRLRNWTRSELRRWRRRLGSEIILFEHGTTSEMKQNYFKEFLAHGQVTIIFVLSVCLFVCAVFLSRLWSNFYQTRTYVICLGLVVSPRI